MRFEQAAELEQGGGIRRGFARQVDADEAAYGLAVVDRVLGAFIRQTEALLRHVHAQHPQHTDRWPATAFALGIVRFNHRDQVGPRRHRFDIRQKPVAPRPLLFASVFKVGKTRLGLHQRSRHVCSGRKIVGQNWE